MGGTITIWSVQFDANCGDHLKIVKDFAGGKKHERNQADKALEKLVERGCNKALYHIVINFAGGKKHQRNLADRALKGLGENGANEELRQVVEELTGGKKHERNLADRALELL